MAPLGTAAYRLQCSVQQYAWGRIGSSSSVAKFAKSGNTDFAIDEDEPYAELWMGTHPKAPSEIVLEDGSTCQLGDWLQKHPEALSSKVSARFGGKLPFLFKVLSVNKALSIQAHPHKELAEKLHATDPAHYPDDNHKPEMAIALTEFEGMCGFRPLQELAGFLKTIPELRDAVTASAADALCDAVAADATSVEAKTCLKACFKALMTQDAAIVTDRLASLVARLSGADAVQRSDLDALLLRLDGQYPGGDVGCFCIYFLNVLKLQEGEAMFLGPNEPHAYLFGDCVECMATSDNVVRAGLTPKFKDVDCLCDMLTYTTEPAEQQLPAGAAEPLAGLPGPSIAIVTSGGGTAELQGGVAAAISTGQVFFIPADTALPLAAGDTGLQIHRAFTVCA